jgi:hypothetical protein
MAKCKEKLKFKRFCAAVRAADSYMEEKALVLDPMVPYRCHKHNCFHIGHNRFMSESSIRLFTRCSRDRTLDTRLNDVANLADRVNPA